MCKKWTKHWCKRLWIVSLNQVFANNWCTASDYLVRSNSISEAERRPFMHNIWRRIKRAYLGFLTGGSAGKAQITEKNWDTVSTISLLGVYKCIAEGLLRTMSDWIRKPVFLWRDFSLWKEVPGEQPKSTDLGTNIYLETEVLSKKIHYRLYRTYKTGSGSDIRSRDITDQDLESDDFSTLAKSTKLWLNGMHFVPTMPNSTFIRSIWGMKTKSRPVKL